MNAKNDYFEAASSGNIEIISASIKAGIDVNSQDEGGNTVLMLALSVWPKNIEDVVHTLIKHHINVNLKCRHGWTALMLAALFGKTVIVGLLIDEHSEVNAQNNDGASALLFAAVNDHAETVKLLLKQGANPNIKGQSGLTVTEYVKRRSARLKHQEIIEWLEAEASRFPPPSPPL